MDIKATAAEAQQTFTELLQLLSTIDEVKFNVVPFDSSWTAGMLAQHIILSADGFVQLLNGPVENTARDPEQHVAQFRAVFLGFSSKMQSPDFIKPEEKAYNKQAAIARLQEIKDALIAAIETLDTSKTCMLYELPGAGHLSRAEAMTFAIVHTERHVHQLKNIKARLQLI